MKISLNRFRHWGIAISVSAAILINGACNKSVAPQEAPPTLVPASVDSNAGNWQMIVLSGPTQIPVAAPAPVTDPSYVAELAAIKTSQAGLTSAQRASIQYWSSGSVIRWNEIMRELVARADLPPAPLANGTYPAPDPANPFADPNFPFSNPPYAARAYSYVSVAQYEALKVAWYYKYQYNRPSPAKVDSGVQALEPVSDLPSYPSEDAVLSGVNSVLLQMLFPTSVAEITQKAAEERQVALLSGKSSASDIAAGLALGQAVAVLFVTRAGTDGFKAATGTAAQWQALAAAIAAQGQIPWHSMELPPRPPMLPFFAGVKAWMMTPTDIIQERPGPPPSTSSAQMAEETAQVKAAVANSTREQQATAYKWNDGANSITPPGHWNLIAVPYISAAKYSEVRAARAFALLNMSLHDAAVACWDVKYTYYNPRPAQMDSDIKDTIPLPNFPAYTSGHSTFSGAAAEVLSYLFPSNTAYFSAQRDEAALSRFYSGIHFPADINVGKDHGIRIGDYTVRFAQHDGAD